MRPQTTATPLTVSRSGTVVVDGYGIRLWVKRGHLMVADGVGPNRRESRFARPTAGIRRVVLLGHTGFVTLGALRWLADVGVGFVHLTPDGRVIATSVASGLDDPRLRRAQALTSGLPSGLEVARDLLSAKLKGQADLVSSLAIGSEAAATIERLMPELEVAASPADLMVVEAAAASAYWGAWSDVPIRWVRADIDKVPDHWRKAGGRTSVLTGNPRLAVNPAQAILNWSYAILEAEARLACLATGLDPGLGVLHADQKSRDSLALDVMEALRPEVDRHVLDLLRTSVFRADDFHETRQGVCRILPPLSHRLAEATVQWATPLGHVVERVAKAFADSPGSRVDRLPTKLTQTNRSAGRDQLRRRPRTNTARTHDRLDRSICRGCGASVGPDQAWCDACRPRVKLEAGLDGLAAARAVRSELRMRGQDPAVSDAAKAKLSKTLRRRRAEESAWDRDHPQSFDATHFQRDLLPLIQEVPVRRLAAMTGLSVGYCALVRRGLRTPHPRWWEVLQKAREHIGSLAPLGRQDQGSRD